MSSNKKIPLTYGLLSLIIMVQEYRKFKINESLFKSSHYLERTNYEKEVEIFFNSIGEDILSKYGLSTNKISYNRVIEFNITDEMLITYTNELPEKFSF